MCDLVYFVNRSFYTVLLFGLFINYSLSMYRRESVLMSSLFAISFSMLYSRVRGDLDFCRFLTASLSRPVTLARGLFACTCFRIWFQKELAVAKVNKLLMFPWRGQKQNTSENERHLDFVRAQNNCL